MSNNHYSFQSIWNIDAPPKVVWETLTATPFSWPEWWPQLKDVHDMKLKPKFTGTSFSCVWQAPIGYRLKSDITIGEIKYLESVRLNSEGDLDGTVTCNVHEVPGGTRIDIDWHVRTTKKWMNYVSFIMRPIFIWSHHSVMKSGERGLRRYINDETNK